MAYETTFSTIDHDNCLGFPHLPYECDDYQVAGDPARDQWFWSQEGGERGGGRLGGDSAYFGCFLWRAKG